MVIWTISVPAGTSDEASCAITDAIGAAIDAAIEGDATGEGVDGADLGAVDKASPSAAIIAIT